MSYTFAAHAADEDFRFFHLLEIVLTSGTFRFTDCDINLSALGHTWTHRGMKLTGITARQNELASGTFQVDNADNVFETDQFGTLNGCAGKAIRVYAASHDPVNNHTNIVDDTKQLYEGVIDTAMMPRTPTESFISFNLAPFVDLASVVMNRRQFSPKCMFIFKEPNSCQYVGADTTCLRTLLDCQARTGGSNEAHFGGFSMLPSATMLPTAGGAPAGGG